MFKIICNGQVMGLCDEVRYIKVKPSTGIFIRAKSREEAQGLAIKSRAYNLQGHDEITYEGEVAMVAFPVEVDGGELLAEEINTVKTDAENTFCELDESVDSRITAIEDALCDLDGGAE